MASTILEITALTSLVTSYKFVHFLYFDLHQDKRHTILGDPGAACRDEGIFVGESLLQQGDEPLGTYSYRTSTRSI